MLRPATFSAPPPLTKTLVVKPPESTCSVPPDVMATLVAVPPSRTSTTPPLGMLRPELVTPDEMYWMVMEQSSGQAF